MWDGGEGDRGTGSEVRARTFQLEGGEYLVLSFRIFGARKQAAALTAAERAVATALLAGATNAEIALRRRRSVNTVAKQVSAIFRKLGVCSRVELARALSNHELGAEAWTR